MALSKYENQLRYCIDVAHLWEVPSKQSKALSVVPLEDLTAIASAKYDSSLEAVSSSDPSNQTLLNREGVIRDLLILELLDWFKKDFFSWTDQPKCVKCNGRTNSIGSASPTLDEVAGMANRIELYKCATAGCEAQVRFPRYNDPGKLLETRTGRCGEWANCFGLICRAAGFETRFVLDFTDHVWVEIYSSGMGSKNRWLHCDPCENKCDSPLMYEKGWGKKLDFVLAASYDDIQDVTWRYTERSNVKEVLKRRACDEKIAVTILREKRKQLQSKVSPDRARILEERLLSELVEFLSEAQSVKSTEIGGRESGSLAWRLARQEIRAEPESSVTKFIWNLVPTKDVAELTAFELRYNPVDDTYRVLLHPQSCNISSDSSASVKGWDEGTHEFQNISLKEETDWKMIYLARQERDDAPLGRISWKFSVPEVYRSSFQIGKVQARIASKTFHSTCNISVRLNSGSKQIVIPETSYRDECWKIQSLELVGSSEFSLVCELSGGSGNIGWQQAQLFRSSLDPAQKGLPVFSVRVELNRI